MKVARTVLGGGKFSNGPTYLNRPYAALLLLIIGVVRNITDMKFHIGRAILIYNPI